MGQQHKGKTQGIAAIDRALRVLDAFLAGNVSLPLAEVARRADLVKPTALRALISLCQTGYLVRLGDGRYQLGAKLMRLGAIYQKNFKLADHVLPRLQRLVDETSESASFFVREGDRRLCLFRIDSPQSVRDVVRVGDLMPIDETSTGQVLATFSEHGSKTETPYRVFASAGFIDSQTASLSTPVFGPAGQLSGALTLSGPIPRFGAVETARMTQLLRDMAANLTSALGGIESEGA